MRVIDVAQLHADQVEDADLGPGQQALNPQPQEAEEDHHDDQLPRITKMTAAPTMMS